MIERLDMEAPYSALEAAIHIGRYLNAKPFCKGLRVLDISCGEGYGTRLLADWGAKEVTGVDISEKTILKATANFGKENIKFITHDAMNLDCFKDDSFDMIVSFETIEHLANPDKFLREIKRVAKDKAKIIISCPNDFIYYPKEEDHNPFHVKKYAFVDFKEMIEAVFGNSVSYMIGTWTQGFSNLNIDSTNDALSKQQDMINLSREFRTQKIQPQEKIDTSNCSYYLAYINIESDKICEMGAAFPKTIHDFDYAYIDLNDRFEKLKVDYFNLEEKYKSCMSDVESIRCDKEAYLERIDKIISENDELNSQLLDAEANNKKLKEQMEETLNEQEIMRREKEQLVNKLDDSLSEIERIKNSRSYRFARQTSKVYHFLFWWKK